MSPSDRVEVMDCLSDEVDDVPQAIFEQANKKPRTALDMFDDDNTNDVTTVCQLER